jgi:hypothetical protein
MYSTSDCEMCTNSFVESCDLQIMLHVTVTALIDKFLLFLHTAQQQPNPFLYAKNKGLHNRLEKFYLNHIKSEFWAYWKT